MKDTVHNFVKFYRRSSAGLHVVVRAVATAILFILAALMEQFIQSLSELANLSKMATRLFLGGFAIFVASALQHLFASVIAELEQHERETVVAQQREEARRREILAYGASLMDQFVTDEISRFQQEEWHHLDCECCFRLRESSAILHIKAIVRLIYQLFESKFGASHQIENRVEFEVTFITRSYLDGDLTIPFYANRNGRRPLSMEKRKANSKIYDNTIAAQTYRNQSPEICIIEDTEREPYAELYPTQKKRIRSSVVFPVRSEANLLLAVLVVHCNQPDLFLIKDTRLWNELLEIFSKRLALEKLRLDRLFGMDTNSTMKPF